ncbi:MAG TPA: gliding motility-associated C-terminal domain-containing protein, partial [Chitinophagales bacterium]|nr:gliding motility-associated C-terminal domain-containing protein [Chitinophagales bacterium]
GCVATDVINVNVFPNLEGIMTVDPTEITIDVYQNETAQLNAYGAEIYQWSPPMGLNNVNISNPIAQPADTTVYIVTGVDANGCTDVDTVTVNVIGSLEIGVPTAFSPNGDGTNDFWFPMISGSGCVESWTVFNRYGEVVFEGNGFCPGEVTQGWDGTYNGELQGIGTYVVIIKAATTLLEDRFVQGNFTLVR